uniref:Spindle and kinetochore associated complex subunit 3 n=1 Tax=Neogobius melanostomus TaxID=47308 RepID=A0A8C6TD78_9GOBI
MDATRGFFSKLRNLAVTLETETTKLQSAFENNKSDDDDCGQYLQTLNNFLKEAVGTAKNNLNEVSRFIKDCDVLQLKLSEDISVIKAHWEKYGYQPLKNTETTNGEYFEAVNEDENQLPDQVERPHQGTGEELSPEKPAAPPADPLRTPQLSDFGLSEVQLKRALGGAWCGEVPQMPELILPHPALNTPAPPTMAITPKRALCMDEDELQTPQMHDFGISEHTMFFNNDFTMNLPLKNAEKTKKIKYCNVFSLCSPTLLRHRYKTFIMLLTDDLESPEPPVFCTPGLKIKKTHPATESSSDSPACSAKLPSTPDVPAFQTPYINQPIKMESEDDSKVSSSSAPPHVGAVPHLNVEGVMAGEIPEMPNLESNLGNSLSAKMEKRLCDQEKPVVKALDLDGPTQEFNLRTPCVRRDYEEPITPEMPDLSSVTQDICKVWPYSHSFHVLHLYTFNLVRLNVTVFVFSVLKDLTHCPWYRSRNFSVCPVT